MTLLPCLVALSLNSALSLQRYVGSSALLLHFHLYIFFIQIIDDVYDRFGHLLRDLDLVWLDTESFAAAVHAKGAPLRQCFGFIDGTVRPIARPTVNQRIMYSGHKRVHCLKFQVCTCVYLCNHDCLTLFFNHLTVCCHTQWFSSAHVRTN